MVRCAGGFAGFWDCDFRAVGRLIFHGQKSVKCRRSGPFDRRMDINIHSSVARGATNILRKGATALFNTPPLRQVKSSERWIKEMH